MNVDQNNYCVIMAGGIGSRFWPMSKTSHPKQFIDILGTGTTLIQQTFNRFLKICPKENILIVTNQIYKDLVMEQLPDILESQVLCEPIGRNTAPCIAYANYKILDSNPDARIVVAPSDHIILDEEAFTTTIESALKASSENNWLITLGIKPSRPDTGYGYIQYLPEKVYGADERLKKVKTFTEKPVLEKAKAFLESGDFLWNAGIFIWSLASINKAFEMYLPEVNMLFKNGLGSYNTPKETEFIGETYAACQNISIDYGVMEKANNVYVVDARFNWSDLGTWNSVFQNGDKNNDDNFVVGINIDTYNSKGNIVNIKENKIVIIDGLQDYIVVDTRDSLLICPKSNEQKIKEYVNSKDK